MVNIHANHIDDYESFEDFHSVEISNSRFFKINMVI